MDMFSFLLRDATSYMLAGHSIMTVQKVKPVYQHLLSSRVRVVVKCPDITGSCVGKNFQGKENTNFI